MRALQQYIDRKNLFGRFTGKTYNPNSLSQQDINELAQSLDCDLSPENLHCDGEISRTEAMKKFRFYTQVARDIEVLCRKQGMTQPTIYEL